MISDFRGENSFLSNFYPTRVSFEGLVYLSSEAAYQAQKTIDPDFKLKFCTISAKDAKYLGSTIKIRPDWNNIKDDIMTRVVKCKFEQNNTIRKKLTDTLNDELVEENTWNDTYWGKCRGKGMNMLGKILMEVRQHFVWDDLKNM